MSKWLTYLLMIAFIGIGDTMLFGQTCSFSNQASGWILYTPDNSPLALSGIRTIPEVTLNQTFEGSLTADADLSINAFGTHSISKHQRPEYDGNIKLFRASVRISSDVFEVRAGLQKINFGSATLFRPLMWFDSVDPRDPLQLTNGVYGILSRYYFLNNANVWLWGLYGNRGTKGREAVATKDKSIEFGGRVQTPLWTGEAGISYHHREADFITMKGPESVPENRLALDGKWDVVVGAWFEAVIVHDQIDIPGLKYQRQWTVGIDYTFEIGNGLTALTEYFQSDHPSTIFGSSDGLEFSGWSLTYPMGTFDRLSAIVYRDWTDHDWYRILTWQRTYDNWIIYLLGFWNPTVSQSFTTLAGTNPFSGKGLQLMIVFNQ